MDFKTLLEISGFLIVAATILTVEFIRGFATYTLLIPFTSLEILISDSLLSLLGLITFLGFSLFLYIIRRLRDNTEPLEAGGKISALVPTYKDHEALERSVESLLNSRYSNLEVVIICEPDDEDGIRKAEELAEMEDVEYLINEGESSKAGAINYAAAETESEFIGFFDADEEVHPLFPGKAAAELEEYDAVGTRTIPRGSSLIESLAYYESVIFSYLARQSMYVFTDFRILGSRGLIMRRDAFSQVGGYDPDMLTEDFEFSHRCYRKGLKTRDLMEECSTIESAHSLKDWWNQRKRWMVGYVQVLHKLLGDLRRDPFNYRSYISVGVAGGTIFGSIFLLGAVSKFAVFLVQDASLIPLSALSTVTLTSLALRANDYRNGQLDSIGYYWLITPFMFPAFSLLIIRSVFEYVFSWTGDWYRVDKLGQ